MGRGDESYFEEMNIHRNSVLAPEHHKEGPGNGDRTPKVALGRREGLGSSGRLKEEESNIDGDFPPAFSTLTGGPCSVTQRHASARLPLTAVVSI